MSSDSLNTDLNLPKVWRSILCSHAERKFFFRWWGGYKDTVGEVTLQEANDIHTRAHTASANCSSPIQQHQKEALAAGCWCRDGILHTYKKHITEVGGALRNRLNPLVCFFLISIYYILKKQKVTAGTDGQLLKKKTCEELIPCQ